LERNSLQTAVVTDSTSDIPDELVQELNIQIVPNIMVIDGQEYEDGKGITRSEFYQRLPQLNPPPTTATSSSGVYTNLYQRLFGQGYDQVVSIHASSILSGIFNAASAAAQAYPGRVFVIDSEQVSSGLGFQAVRIAEQLAQGIQLESILEQLPEFRQRIHLVAMLDTLEFVRRSGRVSWARAHLGNILHIKLFIKIQDGKVIRYGETRTRQKGIERLQQILEGLGPLERLSILHTNAEAEARRFLASLQVTSQFKPILTNVTTILGVHVGPNALGFTAIKQ